MAARALRGKLSLVCGTLRISGKVGANGRGTHCSAVTNGTNSEQLRRFDAPVPTSVESSQQLRGAHAVAAMRILREASGDRLRQGVLLNSPAARENFQDRQHHLRVVGPSPWATGQAPLQDIGHGQREEHFTESVTDG
jgi:hypothetical protein